jgi:hypothetical protein
MNSKGNASKHVSLLRKKLQASDGTGGSRRSDADLMVGTAKGLIWKMKKRAQYDSEKRIKRLEENHKLFEPQLPEGEEREAVQTKEIRSLMT